MAKIKPKSLTCPNCAGTVPVRNVLKAKTVVCRNCDAQIDMSTPNLTLLAQLRKQHDSAFGIIPGMKGTLPDGRAAEVVGRLRFEDSDYEDTWHWDEWLLLAANGEYLWLQENDGRFDLMARFDPADPPDLEDVRNQEWLEIDGVSYRSRERGNPRIVALQGELTWKATVGDRVEFVDAHGNKGHSVSIEWTDDEVEFFKAERISQKQAYKACGLDALIAVDEGLPQLRDEAGAGARSAGCAGIIAGGGAGLAAFGFLATAATMARVKEATFATLEASELQQGVELLSVDLQAGESYTAYLSAKVFPAEVKTAEVKIETPLTGSFPLWSITNPLATGHGTLSENRGFIADSSGTHKLVLTGLSTSPEAALGSLDVSVYNDGVNGTGLFCLTPLLIGFAVALFMLAAGRKARAAAYVREEHRRRRAEALNALHEAATVQE